MPSLCKHHFKWRRGAVVFLVDPIPGLEKQLCHVWWYWSPLFWLTMLTNVNWLHLRGNVSTLKMLADSSSKLTSKRSLKWLKNNGSSRNLHVNAGVKQRGSLRGVDAAPVLALCWCTIAATSVHKSQHVQLRVMLETEIIRHRENQSKTQPWVKPRWAPHTWKENKAKNPEQWPDTFSCDAETLWRPKSPRPCWWNWICRSKSTRPSGRHPPPGTWQPPRGSGLHQQSPASSCSSTTSDKSRKSLDSLGEHMFISPGSRPHSQTKCCTILTAHKKAQPHEPHPSFWL